MNKEKIIARIDNAEEYFLALHNKEFIHPASFRAEKSNNYAETIQTALEAIKEYVKHGWQPIKTAPKDDTDILVLGHENCFWDEENEREYYKDPFICISSYKDKDYRRGFNHRNGARYVTHWKPLDDTRIQEILKKIGE